MPAISAYQANLQTSLKAQESKMISLSQKIVRLKASSSPDPIQQLQTDAIVELYERVKYIQDQLWPLAASIPDVGAVREAAGKTTATQTFTQQGLKTGKFF